MQSSTHKSAMCVSVRISPLRISSRSLSRRDRLHFCDSLQRTTEPREARERNGWPASCLLLHSTSVDSDLGSGIEFAASYQTGVQKSSPSHFRGSPVFSMCVFRMCGRRRCKYGRLKPVFTHLWRVFKELQLHKHSK